MKTQINRTARPRSAFTLLELVIVVAIIGVLLTLLFPAISGILGRADTAQVVVEMTQLDQALQAFSAKYGEYPPSSLSVPLLPSPPALPTWSVPDRAKVRAIWPEFDFDTNGGLNNNAAINLNGAECLVFFLGGVQSGTAEAPVLAGFSKNPLTPWTTSENPDGPFMEFDLSRIVNVDSDSGDLAFEYVDPWADQATPYLYISAAGKRMNRDNNNDLHTLPPENAAAVPSVDDYDVFTDTAQNMSACYLQPDGDDTGSDASNNQPYRKDSFQLISPGEDGEYGTGGVWQSGVSLATGRENEADNITNFSGGPLQP